MACGSKPKLRIQAEDSPQSVLNAYCSYFGSHRSLALKGTFSAISVEVVDCNFEAFYASPDSFNFIAKSGFGIDLARAVLVGDSGFIEIPKRGTFEKFGKNDVIYLDEISMRIDLGNFFRSLFFFTTDCQFVFNGQDSESYHYLGQFAGGDIELVLAREDGLPLRQHIIRKKDTLHINYAKWYKFAGGLIYPREILAASNQTLNHFRFQISRSKADIDIPKFMFESKLANIGVGRSY
jgi:hypothetical protein